MLRKANLYFLFTLNICSSSLYRLKAQFIRILMETDTLLDWCVTFYFQILYVFSSSIFFCWALFFFFAKFAILSVSRVYAFSGVRLHKFDYIPLEL